MAPLTRFQQKQLAEQQGKQAPAPAPAPAPATKKPKPKKSKAPKNPAATNAGVTKKPTNVKGAGPVKKLTKAQVAKKAKDARAAKAPVKKDAPKKKLTKAQAAKAAKKAKEEADAEAEAAAEKDAADKLVVEKKNEDKTRGPVKAPPDGGDGDEEDGDGEDGDEEDGDEEDEKIIASAPTAGQEGGEINPAAQPPVTDKEILAAAAAIRLRRQLGSNEVLVPPISNVTHEVEIFPAEVIYPPPGYDGDRLWLPRARLARDGTIFTDAAFATAPYAFQYKEARWIKANKEPIGSGTFGQAE